MKTDKNKQKIEMLCGRYIISLISCVLSDKKAPTLPPGLSWRFVYELARQHTVENIVCCTFEKMDCPPSAEALAPFKHQLRVSMLRESLQQREIRNISDTFETSGIRNVLLKGGVLKRLYKSPDLRQMGDIDFLIEPRDSEKVDDIMRGMGYSLAAEDGLHRAYAKPPSIEVEIHYSLCDSDLSLVNDYLRGGFELCVLCNEKKYTYEMTHEDFFIYLCAHLAKHFLTYGVGIRFVTDIWVLQHAYTDLDTEYISETLKKTGLYTFAQNIERLCEIWYNGAAETTDFSAMTDYIISSGTYGKANSLMLNGFLSGKGDGKIKRADKAKYILRELFPGKEYLGRRYKAVIKCPVLLPLFWAVRFFDTLFNRKDSIPYRLSGVAMSGSHPFNPSTVTEKLLS